MFSDRFELLSILQVANIYRIPIVHIHGGDKTIGSMDNETRNAITKLSRLHCVVTEDARNNLLELWGRRLENRSSRRTWQRYFKKI